MMLMNDLFTSFSINISEICLENFFLLLLVFVSCAIAVSRSLLKIVILSSMFSMIMAALYLLMAAPDVAMTEAAIGACISTAFIIKSMQATNSNEFKQKLVSLPNIISFFIIIIFGEVMIYAFIDLPEYGQTFSPVNSYLSQYYIQNTPVEIGISSSVAAILGSYRGFDTLGETLVIMVAGIVVYFLMLQEKKELDVSIYKQGEIIYQSKIWMTDYIRVILLPISLIFAFYIQVHGEISPGGGFQAGAIIASVYIFFYVANNDHDHDLSNIIKLLFKFSLVGFLIYISMAIFTALMGGYFLQYYAITGSILGHKIGIFIIEIGVGITIFSVMLMIFLLLTHYARNFQMVREVK